MKRTKKQITPLGQLLVNKARELGLSEREFAEKVLNISANYFYLLKYGEKGQKAPRAETVRKIAKVLNVSPKEVWDIIEQNSAKSAPEPFPGFSEVMELPIRERYEAIWRLVGKKYGLEILHALGDPVFKDKVPILKTEEEVIETYKKVEAVVKRLYNRIQKEIEKTVKEDIEKVKKE